MKVIVIYSSKKQKQSSSEFLEIYNNDLEFFGHSSPDKDFLNIRTFQVENKKILEWFEIFEFSSWWSASPITHPKYNEAMIFIEH